MASPFSIFRKHQRLLLATAAIMAMIAFVFLDPRILGGLMGDNKVANPVMAVSKYGHLTQADVGNLRRERQAARLFFQQLLMAPEVLVPNFASSPYRQSLQSYFARGVSGWVEQMIGPATERSVVDTWLGSGGPSKMGIVVTDQSVRDYIQEQWNSFIGQFSPQGTPPPLDPDRIRNVLAAQHLSEMQLSRALHDEILRLRLRQLFAPSMYVVPPEERWEYFQRTKRSATVELAALPVARLLGKVPDPDEATLTKFFDEHKARLPNPDSPEPGFREPTEITLEYFWADYEKFLNTKAVSDEEVRAYYEQNKDKLFLNYALPLPEATKKPAAKIEKKETEPAEPPSRSLPVRSLAKPAGGSLPVKPSAKPASGAPTTNPSANAKKDAAPAKPAGGAPPAKPSADATKDAVPVRPVSDAAPVKPADARKKDTTAAKPASDAAPAAKPLAPVKKEAAPAAKVLPAKASPAKIAPQPKYRPLAEVKDLIRRELAEKAANAKIDAALKPLREKMDEYSRAMTRYNVNLITDKHAIRPVKPDLTAAAEKSGLQRVELQHLTEADAKNVGLGNAVVGTTGLSMIETTFHSRLYQPDTAIDDVTHSQTLFWKLAEQEEHIPKFDDQGVRAKVLRAWKMVQAAPLARDEAKRLVEKVDKSQGTLKQALKNESAVIFLHEPKAFSWLTEVEGPQGTRRPLKMEVEGVEHPGDEFMRTVFSLKEGRCGAAMNNPRTYAYLIQAITFAPSPTLLWNEFMNDNSRTYATAMESENARTERAWIKDIETEAGFHWEKEPDRREPSQDAGPAPTDTTPYDDSDF